MPHSNFLGRMPWHLRLPNVQAQQPDLNHPCTSNECRFLYPGEKQTQPRRGKGKGISKRSSLQTTQRKPSSRCQSFEYSQCLALKRSTSWSPCRSPQRLSHHHTCSKTSNRVRHRWNPQSWSQQCGLLQYRPGPQFSNLLKNCLKNQQIRR